MIPYHVDIFPWNDSFNTGVDKIDGQHKKLVELLNRVASYITLQRSDVELDSLIKELMDYAVYHFGTEDDYWQETLKDSVYTRAHHDSHNQFIQRVIQLKEDAGSLAEEQWLDELLSFLAGWLASHILESDKYMAILVAAVQSGMSEEDAAAWADGQMRGAVKETINVILAAYKSLSTNTIRLMREIKAGNQILNKLSESEGYLEEAMDYAQIGHWSFPYQGTEACWSPQIFHLLGLDSGTSPCSESLQKIMKDEFRQSFVHSIRKSFETGQEHHTEYQITRPSDGELRWIECRGRVVYKADGTPDKISGFIQDVTERKENEDKITQLAYYDPLTLLPNRRLLLDRLDQTLALSERDGTYNAVLLIDIDNFKNINDSHGHEYGDAFLQRTVSRISNCVRKGDTLARIGGDEFVLILSGLNCDEVEAATEAELVVHKLLYVLALPYQINGQHFNSSASAGVVVFNNATTSSAELVKQADIAMHQAKQAGKNTVFFYQPHMQQVIAKRIRLERELYIAIRKQQFQLYYQPQFDNHDRIIGAEALIRWFHPDDGMISPDDFIPLAEETGLIIPIGDWVLEQACKQLREWKKYQHTQDLTLSINVSYKQFRQPDFVEKVDDLIKLYGVEHGKLKIELTETMLVDDMELTISRMDTLKKKGIRFSLDDFGTGYSSLQYLQRLPLSQLKIDRSFVMDLEFNENDQSIVNTIILMAKTLGLDVIAEGVETKAQRAFLGSHGCFSYQGYYYSKPIPINRFKSFLAAMAVV